MKLYEFQAMISCGVVIAAESEKQAREEIKSYERAWFETGDFIEVVDVELVNERDAKSDDLNDEAHVVSDEMCKECEDGISIVAAATMLAHNSEMIPTKENCPCPNGRVEQAGDK